MAGAYLTIGAKFRPFSYDELMKPVSSMAAAHTAIDEQYAAMQEKANIWENLANKETDKVAYARYKSYSDALKAQADDLAANGLNTQSMKNMLDLRARYSSDIVPIEQAYTRRRQLADEQRKMIMQNPTLKFQRDMNTTSLDEFLENPELDYGYSVNGAMVAKQAGEAYSHLAKAITSEPEYKHILNNNYYQSMLRSGYTPEQILALARNDDSAPAELKAISQQVYDSTGVEDFIKENYPNADTDGNQAMQAQEWRDYVNSYINQGAWNAVGTTNYGTVADPDAALRRSLALQAAKEKASGSGSKYGGQAYRSDAALYGTKGKGQGNREKYMGTATIRSAEDSDMVLNMITRAGQNEGAIEIVDGYDKDGSIKTKSRKLKKLDRKNTEVIALQVDYSTGDLYATIQPKDSNEQETILIRKDRNVYSLQAQGRVDAALARYNDLNIAYAAGRISPEEYQEEVENIKNVMFDGMNSTLQYSGGLNVNTDAGEKRANAEVVEDLSY